MNVTTETIEQLGEVVIRMDFHFIAYEGQNYQCSDPSGAYYAPSMINSLTSASNSKWLNLQPSLHGNHIEKFEFKFSNAAIVDGEPECNAYYFYSSLSEYEGAVKDPNNLHVVFDGSNEEVNPSTGNCDSKKNYDAIGLSSEIIFYNVMCPSFNGGFNPASESNLLNHEFGHSMGLTHTFDCMTNECEGIDIFASEQCSSCLGDPCSNGARCDPSNPQSAPPSASCLYNTNDNIMSYNACQCALTPCQAGKLIERIIGNPPSWLEASEYCSSETDVVIQSGTTEIWDYSRLVSGNVFIEPGARLTITCDLLINKAIIVKRGALLTVLNASVGPLCNDKWNGIKVWGNTAVAHSTVNKSNPGPGDPGIVKLDGATIRDVDGTAVFTNRGGGYFPDHWGGIIIAEYSKFENNKKGAAFMRYDLPNDSYFDNCVFESDDGPGGVSMWRVKGVSFTNCTFKDHGRTNDYGIQASMSSFSVTDGCLFQDLDMGIDASSPIPIRNCPVQIGEEVSDYNEFLNCKVGCLLRHLLDCSVENNFFNVGETGVHITGEGMYNVIKNDFNEFSNEGCYIRSAAPWQSNISCNNVLNSRRGIYIRSRAEGLEFNNNSFYNLVSRNVFGVGVTGLPTQGRSLYPRTNLFTPKTGNNEMGFLAFRVGQYWHPDKENPLTNQDLVPDCAFDPIPEPCSGPSTMYLAKNSDVSESNVLCDPGSPIPGDGDGDPGFTSPVANIQNYNDLLITIQNLKDSIDMGQTQLFLDQLELASDKQDVLDILESAGTYLSLDLTDKVLFLNILNDQEKYEVLYEMLPIGSHTVALAQEILTPTWADALYMASTNFGASEYEKLLAEIAWKERELKSIVLELMQEDLDNSNLIAYHSKGEDIGLHPEEHELASFLHFNDELGAQNYLNSLSSGLFEGERKRIFENVISWNLYPDSSSLDSTFLEDLESMIYNVNTPEYDLARSAWTMITGESLAPYVENENYMIAPDPRVKSKFMNTPALTLSTDIRVTPNPAKNLVQLESILPKEDKIDYFLYNYEGRRVISGGFYGSEQLNISELPDGLYILECRTLSNTSYYTKLIVR